MATAEPERRHLQPVGDAGAAAVIAARALIEIRSLARASEPGEHERLERIALLADLCHNLPMVAGRRDLPRFSDQGRRSTQERAMDARPMSWTWQTSGSRGRALMLAWLDDAGYRWTPPPPLPETPRGAPRLSVARRVRTLAGWPVSPPAGRRPLPREAHVLKALSTDAMCEVYAEAGRRRLGLGGGSGPWLRAHLDPDATHYLVPDPADYYWPHPDGRIPIPWWECLALLTMRDGEQVCTSVAVMPETFTALPSTVPRHRQRQLLQVARATERDTYLWGRDHECTPATCGYTPPPADP
ncbi:hypothetical protein AB0K00_49210 [Dactylosporangium sp. NPDC049525]|uniref:hypothetical protein n=1 Tax=Dactylosporangium sp. NPDC049525 TaxID=3154730 RepID=UPI0034457817